MMEIFVVRKLREHFRLTKLVERLRPKLHDVDLEHEYVHDRRARILPMLRYTSFAYLMIQIAWLFLPGAGIPMEVWVLYRVNGLLSAMGYMASAIIVSRNAKAMLYHNPPD